MARKAAEPGSRRGHAGEPRTVAVKVLFTPGELDKIREAAARDHMAPAAWLGRLGSAAARTSPAEAVAGWQLAAVLRELDGPVRLASRCGVLLDQAVARLHAIGQYDEQLTDNADSVATAVRQMKTVILRAARKLP
jgi:hypothetical protein